MFNSSCSEMQTQASSREVNVNPTLNRGLALLRARSVRGKTLRSHPLLSVDTTSFREANTASNSPPSVFGGGFGVGVGFLEGIPVEEFWGGLRGFS